MANIKISELSFDDMSGIELFNDAEGFMIELTDETEQVFGGLRPASNCGVTNVNCGNQPSIVIKPPQQN